MTKQQIKYLQRHELDDFRWNHCISYAVNGNIYAFSWYLDKVSPGWSALVSGDYEQVFPLPGRKKLGISYLYQPFFTQQLGIFSKTHLTEDIVSEFLKSIPKKYKVIEINLNSYNKVESPGFSLTQQTNLELDLIPTYEEIRKGYNDNLKRNLRKAEDAGLTVGVLPSIRDLIILFRANKGKEIRTFKTQDYNTFEALAKEGERYKAFQSAAAFLPDGELCAGVVFAFSNQKAIFLFSAGNAKAKETAAIPWLIDNFIRHHCETQLTLDFEGSNNPDLARFYRSFGAKDCPYFHLHQNSLPKLLKAGLSIFKVLKEKL